MVESVSGDWLNVVGFALGDSELKGQMESLAALSGGEFYDARGSEELNDAILESVSVPFTVHDSSGDVITQGTVGSEGIEVPAGSWKVVVEGEPQVTVAEVVISPGATTTVEVQREGDAVGTKVRR